METKNAELQRDAAVANAASVYVSAYASGYDAETRAALNDAETQFHADIDAETALDDDLWSAKGTAFTGELTAIRNADTTSDLLSYVSSSVGASISYASSLANAYGDFQIANRQNKLAGTTLFNPRRGAYQADVAWAQQTKSLRNQYYSASGSAISGYYATVNSAIATYNAAALNAVLSAEQSYFNAERTFSQNALDAYCDYVLADFSASKNLALAYLTASVAEVTANYAHEAQLASARAAAYEEAVDALLSDLAAADLKKFETLSTLQENFASAQSSANAADAALGSFNESALAAFQAQTAASAETAKAEADAAYQNSWRSAWNDAFLEMLAETADLSSAYDSIGASTQSALDAADLAYRAAAFGAWEDFLDEALENNQIYAHQQERIDQGGTVANDVFENPTFDYEVCFAVGTQILMADGSTKPIETIRPSDMVLAADHLNPEEKPTAAKVVRFFDNGEKDVVKLLFDNSAQNEEAEEIVCTPEHPFYVIGKGWVRAQDLQQGDFCLSANGEKVAFVSRENLVEKQRVYNFEVDNLHTYFVGTSIRLLVHNFCFGDNEFVMPWDSRANWGIRDNAAYWTNSFHNFVFGSDEMHARNEERIQERGLNPLSMVNDVMGEDVVTHSNEGSYETANNFANTMFDVSLAVCLNCIKPYNLIESEWLSFAATVSCKSFCSVLIVKPYILDVHYNVRRQLNNNEQFELLSDETLVRLHEKTSEHEKVDIFNDGVMWVRMSKAGSRYHGPSCAKFIEPNGRELVISSSKKLETKPQYIGTYNFVVPLSWKDNNPFAYAISNVGHGLFDVLPYYFWGNSIDDPSPFFDRLFGPPNEENGNNE